MQVFADSSLLRRMRLMYFIIVFKFTRVRVDRRKNYSHVKIFTRVHVDGALNI